MDMFDSVIRAGDGGRGEDEGTGLGVATKTKTRTETPPPHQEPTRNPDYTPQAGRGRGAATKTKTRTKPPSPCKVLMLNDDYTPMEFVVLVLQRIFKMGIEDATRVLLHVPQRGVGGCGVFPSAGA